jgi:hypothetical protein
MRQKAGRIRAAGITKEVVFEPVNGAINDRIDAPTARSTVAVPTRRR